MNEPLPVEIKIFTDEMEKHMLKYFDNLSKNKIEEAKESEKAYRDSVIELIKWHYSQNPSSERLNEVLNPLIYIFALFEYLTKLRYYMWLSISRSYKIELNGKAQLFYALPTAFLTPVLLWLFLHKLNLGIEYIFLTNAIIGIVQWLLTEIYFRKNLNKPTTTNLSN